MTGFNHGITGAVIALTVKNPVLAVPLSFISHFVQDTIPHWDFGASRETGKKSSQLTRRFKIFLLSDFCLSLTLMVVLATIFPAQKWLIWGCMVAAASPDLAWSYYFLYREHIKKQKTAFDPLSKLHLKIQWSATGKGFFVELAWAITGLFIILSFL